MTASTDAVLARVVRDHSGQLAACLVSLLGDFSAAEDLVSDAVLVALQRWPTEDIPDRPDAWLFTVANDEDSMCCAARPATATSSPSCNGPPLPSPTTGCG